jgi:hypothetical protein
MTRLQWWASLLAIFLFMVFVSWKWALACLILLPFFSNRIEKERPRPHGFVYFLADDEAGLVKIGRTKSNPKYRIARLQGQSPHPLRLLYYYDTPNMEVEEAVLHDTFAHCRRHGEWFDLECVHDKIFKKGGEPWERKLHSV